MKLITRNTDYALRAICFIAESGKEVVSVSSLFEALGVPRPFLRKILQILHNHGVLKSWRGKSGGFSLLRGPKTIFLWDIMRIFQGRFCLNECFLRKRLCPNIKKCILRGKINRIEKYVFSELKEITIDCLLGHSKIKKIVIRR
ncbi:MAG: Rrf2 family transcriptional regulator [Candidatus Omnitrophota bacterium]|jgi:Rrf2 family protein